MQLTCDVATDADAGCGCGNVGLCARELRSGLAGVDSPVGVVGVATAPVAHVVQKVGEGHDCVLCGRVEEARDESDGKIGGSLTMPLCGF